MPSEFSKRLRQRAKLMRENTLAGVMMSELLARLLDGIADDHDASVNDTPDKQEGSKS